MNIKCYVSQGCSTEDSLRQNIESALKADNVIAAVNIERIDDGRAIELKLSGSPSVFINNVELQPLGFVGLS
jgi:hypothetical protein